MGSSRSACCETPSHKRRQLVARSVPATKRCRLSLYLAIDVTQRVTAIVRRLYRAGRRPQPRISVHLLESVRAAAFYRRARFPHGALLSRIGTHIGTGGSSEVRVCGWVWLTDEGVMTLLLMLRFVAVRDFFFSFLSSFIPVSSCTLCVLAARRVSCVLLESYLRYSRDRRHRSVHPRRPTLR